MSISKLRSGALLAVFVLLATGCASNSGVTSQPLTCCAQVDYKTFTLSAAEMPIFLRAVMTSNFVAAFAAKGLQPVAENGELEVTLRYVQTDLPQGGDGRGDNAYDEQDSNYQIAEGAGSDASFGESLGGGGDAQFIAQVLVEMREPGSKDIVWSGSIQRLHYVSPGEWMHTGDASAALHEAFTNLLDNYPGD